MDTVKKIGVAATANINDYKKAMAKIPKLASQAMNSATTTIKKSTGLIKMAMQDAFKLTRIDPGPIERSIVAPFSKASSLVQQVLSKIKFKLPSVNFGSMIKSANSAAKSIGSTFASASGKAVSALSKIGASAKRTESLTKSLVKSAGLLGAAYAALNAAKSAASSAFDRVNVIDTSTKSLSNLMQDGEKATKVMNDLTDAIDGTPIALNEVSMGAKKLVAAGMDASKVKETFEAIADAAYGVGNGAESIDSIVHAFSQMQSSSQLYLEDLNQLQDQGVPALKILANQAGISADEMKASISDGAIDSKWAMEQLKIGIENGTSGVAGATSAMKGLAKTAGDTMGGALSNLKTAFVTTAAEGIEPFKLTLIDTFKNATTLVKQFRDNTLGSASAQEKLTSAAQKMGEIVNGLMAGSMSASDALKQLTSNVPGVDKLALSLGSLLVIDQVMPLFAKFGSIAASVLPQLSGLTGIFAGLASVATSLAGVSVLGGGLLLGLGALNDQFGKQIDAIIATVTNKVPQIVATFAAKLAEKGPALMKSGADLVLKIVGGINQVLPSLLASATSIVNTLMAGFVQNSPNLIASFIETINHLAAGVAQIAPQLINAGLQLIVNLATGIANGLPQFIDSVANLLNGVGQAIIANLPALLTAGLQIVEALGAGLVANLPMLVETASQMLIQLANGLVAAMPVITQVAINVISVFTLSLLNNIDPIVNAAVGLIGALVKALIEIAPILLTAAVQIVSQLASSLAVAIDNNSAGFSSTMVQLITILAGAIAANLPTLISAAIQLTVSLLSAILNALPSLGKALWQGFMQISEMMVKGLVEGLVKYGGKAVQSVVKFGGRIIDGLKNLLGIHSPSRVMAEIGTFTGQGFVNGLASMTSAVDDQAAELASKVTDQQYEANLDVRSNATDLSGGVNTSLDRLSDEVKNVKKSNEQIVVNNELVGEKIQTTVNKRNADEDVQGEFYLT